MQELFPATFIMIIVLSLIMTVVLFLLSEVHLHVRFFYCAYIQCTKNDAFYTFFFPLATPPTVEEILDKMNYELVMSLTVEAPVSNY